MAHSWDFWLLEGLGIAGSLLLLLSYFMTSTHRLPSRSPGYQALNLAGAALLGINTAFHRAWAPTALEVIWCIIALRTLVRIQLKRG